MRGRTNLKTWWPVWAFLLAMVGTTGARTIYVDCNAPGPVHDGSNWPTAYNYLQEALEYAQANPDVNEMRIAQGTYKPDQDTAHPNGTGERTATFQIKNGVAIKGGYAGCDANDPNARDIQFYKTILSGDLNNDDGPDFADNGENSFHVVTASRTDETATLDAFTITAGNANGDYTVYRHSGGGIFNRYGKPTVTNCTLVENRASGYGGGMYNFRCSPRLINCKFIGNKAGNEGGGIRNYYGAPLMANCTFVGNYARWDGGGIAGYSSSKPTLINCTFSGNWAGYDGGAISNDWGGNATVINSTFSGNCAAHRGGGVSNNKINCSPRLTNCIIWGNIDSGGTDEGAQIYRGTPLVNYSSIEGLTGSLGGIGNIGSDPCFVDGGHWDMNGTPDDANDDFWVDGDYHLLPDSPCIDAGDNNSVPPDDADLDGDGNTTELIPFDLDGNPRIVDGNSDANSVVDMGAYEFCTPPLEVWMKFTPQALNPGSKGNWMKAHFVLPEEYGVGDVDANRPAVVEPGGIESDYMNVFVNDDGLVEIEAAFDRGEFCSIVTGGEPMEVTVVGWLTSGQQFYGTDTIKITTSYLKYLGTLASR